MSQSGDSVRQYSRSKQKTPVKTVGLRTPDRSLLVKEVTVSGRPPTSLPRVSTRDVTVRTTAAESVTDPVQDESYEKGILDVPSLV